MRQFVPCRYPGCFKRKESKGLCTKHKKWLYRGYIDIDLNILKPIRERPGYKDKKCKVYGCQNPPRRNWMCGNHSSALRNGRITEDGEKIWKRAAKYPKDFECVYNGCGKRGKISKGFCKKHYEWLRKGIIDFDGVFLRPFKRIAAYGPDDRCKAQRCTKRPTQRGWCHTHITSFKRGIYDEKGRRIVPEMSKNKGFTCKESGCTESAITRGMCKLHYVRYRTGYLGPEGYKNSGKLCSEEGCGRPAHCRTMCSLHYSRWKKAELMNRDSQISGQAT